MIYRKIDEPYADTNKHGQTYNERTKESKGFSLKVRFLLTNLTR